MRGCLVDKSHQADNYRGEFLGALGPLLLLRAAFMANPQLDCSHARLELYCDNKGVVTHGNQPNVVLKADQVQADLIRLMKTYTRLIPAQLQWIHVMHGHLDTNTPFAQLTIIQQLNVRCNQLARWYLVRAIMTGDYFFPPSPMKILFCLSTPKKSDRQPRSKYIDNGASKLHEICLADKIKFHQIVLS
eukprot:scaffold17423_cov52-Cyclotella_meneghiniana.AAC.3